MFLQLMGCEGSIWVTQEIMLKITGKTMDGTHLSSGIKKKSNWKPFSSAIWRKPQKMPGRIYAYNPVRKMGSRQNGAVFRFLPCWGLTH